MSSFTAILRINRARSIGIISANFSATLLFRLRRFLPTILFDTNFIVLHNIFFFYNKIRNRSFSVWAPAAGTGAALWGGAGRAKNLFWRDGLVRAGTLLRRTVGTRVSVEARGAGKTLNSVFEAIAALAAANRTGATPQTKRQGRGLERAVYAAPASIL